jgi:colanic acid biosynthesis glycosyl transferase WcaI
MSQGRPPGLSGRRRWLIVSQYFAPEIGAPQIRLRAMARELRRHGISLEVLTALPNYPSGKVFPGYQGRLRLREQIDEIPVLRTWVYAATGRSASARLANYLSFTLSALVAMMLRRKPDVLFVESQPLSLGLVAVFMKWVRGVPYIYNVPDLQVDVARQLGFLKSPGLLNLATRMESLFLREAASVSTVTEGFVGHFVGRGIPRNRVSFLPNGADTEFLRPRPPSPSLLGRWKLAGKKVFVYVGTHAFYHGLDTLLDAAALLRDRKDVAFLLVGDGPERERLRQRSGREQLANVVFGDSPYEEMPDLYSIAWASVATLRNMAVASGMRLSKVFPSFACSVPVVYSGSGEAADLIEAHSCGIVVPPESPDALAEAVRKLADSRELRDRMGQAGRAFVEADYSWSVIVTRWLREIGWESGSPAETEGCETEGKSLEALTR